MFVLYLLLRCLQMNIFYVNYTSNDINFVKYLLTCENVTDWRYKFRSNGFEISNTTR